MGVFFLKFVHLASNTFFCVKYLWNVYLYLCIFVQYISSTFNIHALFFHLHFLNTSFCTFTFPLIFWALLHSKILQTAWWEIHLSFRFGPGWKLSSYVRQIKPSKQAFPSVMHCRLLRRRSRKRCKGSEGRGRFTCGKPSGRCNAAPRRTTALCVTSGVHASWATLWSFGRKRAKKTERAIVLP